MAKNKAPLYLSVKSAITDLINDDRYEVGDKLESETALAERMGVSRMTVRQALAELEEEGYLQRSQGMGTRLLKKPHRVDLTLDKVGRLSSILGPDVKIETTMLTIEERPASELVAKKLQIGVDDPIIEYKRVRTVNGVPAIFTVDYLAKERIPGRVDYENAGVSLTQAMGVEIQSSSIKLVPTEAGAEIGRYLGVTPATLCLMAVELGCDPQGQPINYANEYYLSNRFNFLVVRHKL